MHAACAEARAGLSSSSQCLSRFLRNLHERARIRCSGFVYEFLTDSRLCSLEQAVGAATRTRAEEEAAASRGDHAESAATL